MPNPSKEIRLIALGQALIEHDLREHSYPGLNPLAEHLKQADICFSNFEGTIQSKGAMPTREGTFLHGAPPQVLDCLKDFSINLLALSNNHAFDFGAAGIVATRRETQQRGFVCAGTGANLAEASAPAFLEDAIKTVALTQHHKKTASQVSQSDSTKNSQNSFISESFCDVALVAFASKIPDGSAATHDQPGVNALRLTPNGTLDPNDTQRILGAIQHAARTANLVIAYHHDHYWEPNWQETPRWKQTWARECIDAGASAYISHGVPLLHAIEIYKRHPIFYGLGNFIFHTKTPVGRYEPAVWESVIAECTYRGGEIVGLKLRALVLNESGEPGENFFKTRGRPSFADYATARKFFARLHKLFQSFGTRLRIESDFAEIEI